MSLELIAGNQQNTKVRPIFQQNCFVFENIYLYVKEPSSANVIFFEANLTGISTKTNKEMQIKTFKFGVRLELNKTQYRYLDVVEAVIHTEFDCWLI